MWYLWVIDTIELWVPPHLYLATEFQNSLTANSLCPRTKIWLEKHRKTEKTREPFKVLFLSSSDLAKDGQKRNSREK